MLPFLTFPAAAARPPYPSVQGGAADFFPNFSGRLGAQKNGEKPDARFGSKKNLPEGPVKFWEAFFFHFGQKNKNFRARGGPKSTFFIFDSFGRPLGASGGRFGSFGSLLGPNWANVGSIGTIFGS